jgi:hypothetical protein
MDAPFSRWTVHQKGKIVKPILSGVIPVDHVVDISPIPDIVIPTFLVLVCDTYSYVLEVKNYHRTTAVHA